MTKPLAKDLSHLLSEESKSRNSSPLKSAFKYFGAPGMTFLGGGLPLSDYFPFDKITADIPTAPFVNGIGAQITKEDKTVIEIHKKKELNSTEYKDAELSRTLQYGYTEGVPELVEFLREHTEMVHAPKYEDWALISSIGNTESWDSTLRTFTERGDSILVEQYSFSSALECANALGVTTVPMTLDAEGIVPGDLAKQLDNWVGKKPKFIYTICTGQNPTGSSLSKERRLEIYEIAKKHDLIIVEDEPYYFLQMEPYTTDLEKRKSEHIHLHDSFVKAMVASFLSIDTEGRVIRLDSLSKVLAPGLRYGWIIGQANLIERYVRLHEVSVQAPSGLTQTLTNALLQRWGQSGYLDWLIGLRSEYTTKRDVAVDAVLKYFPQEVTDISPPVAGMFFTTTFDASKHPEFASKYDSDPLKVETAIYERALAEGCLMIPGSWFEVTGATNPPQPTSETTSNPNLIFFRGTYAAVPLDALEHGLEKFGKAVKLEYGL